jgi:hypothetical protein
MATLNSLLDRFLRERTYLENVSPKTRIWYETAWKTFLRTQGPLRHHAHRLAPGDHTAAPAGVRGRAPRPWCPCRDGEHMAVRLERLLPLAARRRHHPPRAGQAPAVESTANCDAPPPGMSALRRGRNRVMCAWGRRSCPSTQGPQAPCSSTWSKRAAPQTMARARTLPRLPASWLYRAQSVPPHVIRPTKRRRCIKRRMGAPTRIVDKMVAAAGRKALEGRR